MNLNRLQMRKSRTIMVRAVAMVRSLLCLLLMDILMLLFLRKNAKAVNFVLELSKQT